MARAPDDLLRLLANPTNRNILSVLAVEPQYPRRLAELVGLTEAEAGKRLRAFEKAGVVEAEWANLGKNVRLYKLLSPKIEVHLGPGGVTVAGLGDDEPMRLGPAAEPIPVVPRFAGRSREMAGLDERFDHSPAVCVHGLGGVGKTALAAAVAARTEAPVVWHTVHPGETAAVLLGRLASGLMSRVDAEEGSRLLTVRAAEDPAAAAALVAQTADAVGALLVVDKMEVASDDAAATLGLVAQGLNRARLVVTGRVYPRRFPRATIASFPLAGVGPEDVFEMAAAYGRPLDEATAQALWARTRGHSLAVVLMLQAEDLSTVLEGTTPVAEEEAIRTFLVDDLLPQLRDVERRVLFRLAILRMPFLRRDAERLVEDPNLGFALSRLEGRGLVVRAGEAFMIHDLVRTFASEVAPDRARAHADAARLMRDAGEPEKALEAVFHFTEAGDLDGAGSIVLEEATERVYRFADLGLGARWAEVLARLAGEPGLPDAVRAAVAVERAAEAAMRRDVVAARELLADSAAAGDEPASIVAARTLLGARLERLGDDEAAAEAAFVAAEEAALGLGDQRALLEVLVDRALFEEERDADRSLAYWQRALDVGRASSDVRLSSLAYSGAARLRALKNDEGFLDWAHEGLRLARASGFLRGEVGAYMTLATHLSITEGAASRPYVERYRDVAERLGDPWFRACSRINMTRVLLHEARSDEALGVAEECLGLAGEMNNPFYKGLALLLVVTALRQKGHLDEALERLTLLEELQDQSVPFILVRGLFLQAELEEQAGREDLAAKSRDQAHAVATAAGWDLADKSRYDPVGDLSPLRLFDRGAKPGALRGPTSLPR